MPTDQEPLWLELDGVSRCYRATVAGRTIRHEALPATTLRVRRGEWVAVAGAGAGTLTLLRCAAGLVRPDTGRVRWLDHAGREAAPGRNAFIHAQGAPYACWTVRDALWAASSPRAELSRAERGVELALRVAGLSSVADRRVVELHALEQWRVNVAAAVAGGARWLFVELPPLAAGGAPPAASPSPSQQAMLHRMGCSLAASGIGALVAGSAVVPFPIRRRFTVAASGVAGEGSAGPAGPVARVAEPAEGEWEGAGIGVASPLRQL